MIKHLISEGNKVEDLSMAWTAYTLQKRERVWRPPDMSGGRDVRWSKFVRTGKERNEFPFKKDLSLSRFFFFFSLS